MPIPSETALCNMAIARVGVAITLNNYLLDTSQAARACQTFYAQCRDQLLAMYRWPFALKRQQLLNWNTGAQPWASGTTYANPTAPGAGTVVVYGDAIYRAIQYPAGFAANLNQVPSQASGYWMQLTRDGWTYVAPLPTDFIEAVATYEAPSQVAGAGSPNGPHPSYTPIRNARNDERIPFALEDATDGTDQRLFLSDVDTPVLEYIAQVTNTNAFPPLFVSALAWLLARELVAPLRADPGLVKVCHEAFMNAVGEAASAEQRGEQEDPEPVSDFEGAREGAYGRGNWSSP